MVDNYFQNVKQDAMFRKDRRMRPGEFSQHQLRYMKRKLGKIQTICGIPSRKDEWWTSQWKRFGRQRE